MGFREAALLGFVLLFSCGNPRVASQNWSNLSTNEALNQVPQEQVTGSLQVPGPPQNTEHQSNRTEQSEPARFSMSYRLRTYQLRNPAVSKQKPAQPLVAHVQTFQDPPSSEAGRLTSEQLEPRSADFAHKLLELPVQSPDLNPPVKQKSKAPVKVEQRVPADSVVVRCGERQIVVEVRQNFLGNGQSIRPSDLTLGGCAALDTADHILQFRSELQGCGSKKMMTENALIYSFSLLYSPTPIGKTFILKTNPAEVLIKCHYQRRHYVSSNAVGPTWMQFASVMPAERQLQFSLRLMTEDWQSQRPSSVYFLSDVMHIEAAVLQGHHVPLRVYVDRCVATASPNPSSQPRYPFINNHGCLTDAKLTGAKSYFMQRSQEDKLHFLLKAFKFHQDHRNSLYITCHLKARMVSVPIDSRHKACSFLTEANRWVASGGDNEVCSCCESSCSEQRRTRSLAADAGVQQWEGMAALGPILLEENILREELSEVSQLPLEPLPLLQTRDAIQAACHPLIALLCGVSVALTVALLVFTGAATCCRLRKPT